MSKKKGVPKIVNKQLFSQAGIDYHTGLPSRLVSQSQLKSKIKRALSIVDEQDAVNRYQWYNIPCDITGQELERLLYIKGQLCFFLNPNNDKFYFMPYALDGSIDFYGRFKTVHPIPFADAGEDDSKDMKLLIQKQRILLSTLKLKVIYGMPTEPINPYKIIKDTKGNTKQNGVCVLLHDYSKGLSQTVIPRREIQEPIIDLESDMLPYCRTALRNSVGIKGLRVGGEDERINVDNANALIEDAALNGEKYIPIIGNMAFQDLPADQIAKAEEFLMPMQSVDNLRLSLYGLKNGGIFQKKSHILESEQDLNSGDVQNVLQDGLAIRQEFCDIVNTIFGTGMYCEISDSAISADSDMDGITADERDQTGIEGSQEAPSMEE